MNFYNPIDPRTPESIKEEPKASKRSTLLSIKATVKSISDLEKLSSDNSFLLTEKSLSAKDLRRQNYELINTLVDKLLSEI